MRFMVTSRIRQQRRAAHSKPPCAQRNSSPALLFRDAPLSSWVKFGGGDGGDDRVGVGVGVVEGVEIDVGLVVVGVGDWGGGWVGAGVVAGVGVGPGPKQHRGYRGASFYKQSHQTQFTFSTAVSTTLVQRKNANTTIHADCLLLLLPKRCPN